MRAKIEAKLKELNEKIENKNGKKNEVDKLRAQAIQLMNTLSSDKNLPEEADKRKFLARLVQFDKADSLYQKKLNKDNTPEIIKELETLGITLYEGVIKALSKPQTDAIPESKKETEESKESLARRFTYTSLLINDLASPELKNEVLQKKDEMLDLREEKIFKNLETKRDDVINKIQKLVGEKYKSTKMVKECGKLLDQFLAIHAHLRYQYKQYHELSDRMQLEDSGIKKKYLQKDVRLCIKLAYENLYAATAEKMLIDAEVNQAFSAAVEGVRLSFRKFELPVPKECLRLKEDSLGKDIVKNMNLIQDSKERESLKAMIEHRNEKMTALVKSTNDLIDTVCSRDTFSVEKYKEVKESTVDNQFYKLLFTLSEKIVEARLHQGEKINQEDATHLAELYVKSQKSLDAKEVEKESIDLLRCIIKTAQAVQDRHATQGDKKFILVGGLFDTLNTWRKPKSKLAASLEAIVLNLVKDASHLPDDIRFWSLDWYMENKASSSMTCF